MIIFRNVAITAFVAGVACSVSNVQAGHVVGSKYAGLQYTATTYSKDGSSAEFEPTVLVGRLGVNLTRNMSVEGRIGLGMGDDTLNISGTNTTMEIDSLVGVYGVGHIFINRTSSLYGMLGLSRADATISATGFSTISDDGSGLSIGVGADMGINKDIALNIEYVQYLNKSDFNLDAVVLGVKFGF